MEGSGGKKVIHGDSAEFVEMEFGCWTCGGGRGAGMSGGISGAGMLGCGGRKGRVPRWVFWGTG
eukprot:TRINITY_DN13011_c0_g1_i1.p2 TRINITY_DN13011_c0_g1~~TRINITY_DN13011_c0_g1_i1.p2  ORF type:complete len:64 (+),score=7.34 TRINITY_DN13011_c0_g1_i1:201-392(+)